MVFLFQLYYGSLDQLACLPFSVAIQLWACLMLAVWRQQGSILAHRWGVLDFEAEETERPQFRGTYVETGGDTS